MGGRRRFDDATEDEILVAYETLGLGVPEIAEAYGCSRPTVRAAVARARGRRAMTSRDVIVAGDRATGQLRAVGPDDYEGTRRLPNGKFASKRFHGDRAEVELDWRMWGDEEVAAFEARREERRRARQDGADSAPSGEQQDDIPDAAPESTNGQPDGASDVEVFSPSHYADNGRSVETIDVLEGVVDGLPAREAYLLGNVVKYVLRAGLKGDAAPDVAKANNYAWRLVTGDWRDRQ